MRLLIIILLSTLAFSQEFSFDLYEKGSSTPINSKGSVYFDNNQVVVAYDTALIRYTHLQVIDEMLDFAVYAPETQELVVWRNFNGYVFFMTPNRDELQNDDYTYFVLNRDQITRLRYLLSIENIENLTRSE
jgi:hypothetical protein